MTRRRGRPAAQAPFPPPETGHLVFSTPHTNDASKTAQRIVSAVPSADQDVISAVGGAMAGLFNTAHWSPDLDNPANRKFVAQFQKAYNRVPTLYASQGYDTALLIDAAVRGVKGKVGDRQAFRQALRTAKFESVRGPFRFNKNQYPIQNYYVRTIGNDGKGGLVNKSFSEPILRDHGDAYVQQCQMK